MDIDEFCGKSLLHHRHQNIQLLYAFLFIHFSFVEVLGLSIVVDFV